MKRFDKRIKAGTKAKLYGIDTFFTVLSVSKSRYYIVLKEIIGSHQHGHVEKFKNIKKGIK